MTPSPDEKSELDRLAELVDSLVSAERPGQLLPLVDVRNKVDWLERALETWRIHNRCLENKLPLEEFLQSEMLVDGKTIQFHHPEQSRDLGSGTPPIRLQPRLLLFLLLHHRRAYAIYDIIEKFIEKIWDELKVLDFKKTRTGVVRCFTNTRFAAHTLRHYGLLKFTQKEAYRTWMLSLPGFLVAAKALQAGVEWKLSEDDGRHNFDLHQDIRTAWSGLQTFDQFVDRLSSICEPNAEVFGTFGPVLRKAYELLGSYWQVLQDHKLSQKARKAETARRLLLLDQQPRMEDFYREVSACVNVERLLGQLD